MPHTTNPCATCMHLIRKPRGNRETVICSKANRNAYEERGDPAACGAAGKNWTAVARAPQQT